MNESPKIGIGTIVSILSLVAIGIGIGIFITLVLPLIGGRFTKLTIGPAEVELPTANTPAPAIQQPLSPTAVQAVSTSVVVIQPTSTPDSSPQVDCSKMIEGEHHNPTLGVEWKFEPISENRIIHVWSNHWSTNLPEFKYFLPAGESVSFMSGGGSVWTERPGCNGVAQVIYQRDVMKEISFENYQKYIEQQVIP